MVRAIHAGDCVAGPHLYTAMMRTPARAKRISGAAKRAGDDRCEAMQLEPRLLLAAFDVPESPGGQAAVAGDQLYVVGSFERAGGVYSPKIAAYDLTQGRWRPVDAAGNLDNASQLIHTTQSGRVFTLGWELDNVGLGNVQYHRRLFEVVNDRLEARGNRVPLQYTDAFDSWQGPGLLELASSPTGDIYLWGQPPGQNTKPHFLLKLVGDTWTPVARKGSPWLDWSFRDIALVFNPDGTFRELVGGDPSRMWLDGIPTLPSGMVGAGLQAKGMYAAERVGAFIYAVIGIGNPSFNTKAILARFDTRSSQWQLVLDGMDNHYANAPYWEGLSLTAFAGNRLMLDLDLRHASGQPFKSETSFLVADRPLDSETIPTMLWGDGIAAPQVMFDKVAHPLPSGELLVEGGKKIWSPGGTTRRLTQPNDFTGPNVSIEFTPDPTSDFSWRFNTPTDPEVLGFAYRTREINAAFKSPLTGHKYSGPPRRGVDPDPQNTWPYFSSAGSRPGVASAVSVDAEERDYFVTRYNQGATLVVDAWAYDAHGNYTFVGTTPPARIVQPAVIYVPSFMGSLPRFDLANQSRALEQAIHFVSNIGYAPNLLYPEQVNKSANLLLETFDGVAGYRLGENLTFAAYDWRLPVAPHGARDGLIELSRLNLADDKYEYAAEYLAYWIERAKDGYRAQYGDLIGFRLNLVAHGTGGLIARAFLQSDVYQAQYAGTVRKVLNIGTPHLGFVDAFYYSESTVGELLNGVEPRSDSDSQQYIDLLRQASDQAGISGTKVRQWVTGIDDYQPTFDFIKRGPDGYPPPADSYVNPFLLDLNADPAQYTGRVPSGVINVFSTGVSTPSQVYYSFGGREQRTSDQGDGFALAISAAPSGFGTPYEFADKLPRDQRDLINDQAPLAVYRQSAALDPGAMPWDPLSKDTWGSPNKRLDSSIVLGSYSGRTTSSLKFSVTYIHVDDLEISSFTDGDVTVVSPTGAPLAVRMVHISDASVFGPVRTVVYEALLPTGAWRDIDFGNYQVTVNASQVRSYKGEYLPSVGLGSVHASADFGPLAAGDRFLNVFGSASSNGFVNGDWIVETLRRTVPGVSSGAGYWGGISHWFQTANGNVWTLWHGGPVHTSTTRAGEMRWLLTNLTEAAGLTGQLRFVESSLSGIVTGWNAFNVQGVMDGKLWALWWSPEGSAGSYVDTSGTTKQGKAFGLRGNGWVLSSISDALTPINGAIAAPPATLRPFSFSQGNSRTDFDPRSGWYTANNGMSVIVVDSSDRVYAATFNVWQRDIPGADAGMNGKWLIERLGDLPSLPKFGVLDQLGAFEQQYIAASKG